MAFEDTAERLRKALRLHDCTKCADLLAELLIEHNRDIVRAVHAALATRFAREALS
jgi:hypothetical protein